MNRPVQLHEVGLIAQLAYQLVAPDFIFDLDCYWIVAAHCDKTTFIFPRTAQLFRMWKELASVHSAARVAPGATAMLKARLRFVVHEGCQSLQRNGFEDGDSELSQQFPAMTPRDRDLIFRHLEVSSKLLLFDFQLLEDVDAPAAAALSLPAFEAEAEAKSLTHTRTWLFL